MKKKKKKKVSNFITVLEGSEALTIVVFETGIDCDLIGWKKRWSFSPDHEV